MIHAAVPFSVGTATGFTGGCAGVYMGSTIRIRAKGRHGMEPSAPRPATGLTTQLRAATRGTHDHVDGAFPDGLDSPAVYVRYLQAILPLAQWLHHSWQPAWQTLASWHAPARPQQLRADLSRLGAAPAPFH